MSEFIYFVFVFGLSFHYTRHCPTEPAQLATTFVFAQWWLVRPPLSRVGKRCRINVLNTLTSRHHCANILLPAVLFQLTQRLSFLISFHCPSTNLNNINSSSPQRSLHAIICCTITNSLLIS
jgi:hypothetical protein